MTKKIGILGSGPVAQVLGNGFVKHGYDVMIGTRDHHKLADWQASTNGKGSVGTFEEAAKFGSIIVLAVKGDVAVNVAKQVSLQLIGKTVIDTTNPIAPVPPEHGVLKYFTSLDTSLLEQLQRIEDTIHFVKAFNSVGNARMVNPDFKGGRPTMFICGNNEGAKKDVIQILDLFGWETEDFGKAEAARAIEPLCMLWCIPGFLHNQWTHAFKLLRS